MVGPDSHSFSRGGCYLGNTQKRVYLFTYRTITFYGPLFQDGSVKINFCNFSLCPYNRNGYFPQPRMSNGIRPWHSYDLDCFPFARRY